MNDVKMQDIDKILAGESAELLEAMKRNEPGAQERLVAWLSESRRHVQHYLMMVALDRELDSIDVERRWNLGPAQVQTQNVVTLAQASHITSAQSANRRLAWSFAAGSVAVLLVLTGVYGVKGKGYDFATAVGEQRSIKLDDGSVVHLNTHSRVNVKFSAHERNVHLLSGEALFKVNHDSSRPFRVYTSDALIRALGTEFNVYHRAEGTLVTVLEGRVQVREVADTPGLSNPVKPLHSATLDAGQEARIDSTGSITKLPSADTGSLLAWRQRRLVFKATPLPEMIAEFNRYNRVPHFELQGPNPQERVFSGIFDADDPQSLIELLKSEPGLAVEGEGDQVVIRVGVAK